MSASTPDALAVKALTLTETNPARGLPTIQGVLLIFAAADGTLRGVIDGGAVTAIRTAAIAAWATERLAPADASQFLLVGAGAQARSQVAAMLVVRPIRRVVIWNRTGQRATDLATELAACYPDVAFSVSPDLRADAMNSEIISLVTASHEPLLSLGDLPEDCHINAMGAHEPSNRELASDILAVADVYADTVYGCLKEAGDLLIPIGEGLLATSQVQALAGATARKSRITVMKSVGSAIFDLACGSVLLETADTESKPIMTAGPYRVVTAP
jgi:ornithine cyclodeaminase